MSHSQNVQPTAVRTLVKSVAALALATNVQAAITYVDITDGPTGNTTMFSNSVWQAWAAFNGQTGNSNDRIWDKRAFGNSATIFQNAANALVDTNATRLRTTIMVPTPGPSQYYNVYALFWTIRARPGESAHQRRIIPACCRYTSRASRA